VTLTAVGQTLLGNRYRLGERIALGGAAEIYEAADVLLGRTVAVKVLTTDAHDAPHSLTSQVERFHEEARLLAAVHHRHLVPLLDAGLDGAWRYLVMPLIRGENLADVLERGALPPTEAARVGAALADALAHIHARGIVHRDLKPANVLMAESGTVYLADFGIARAWNAPVHTAAGLVVGTAGYMAPEQARGHVALPASDVFSLGLILLEALTGQPEYVGPPLERIAEVVNRAPRVPPGLTSRWRAVLAAALRHEPGRRPSAEQLRNLIAVGCQTTPAAATVAATASPAPVTAEEPPVRRRSVAEPSMRRRSAEEPPVRRRSAEPAVRKRSTAAPPARKRSAA
jgi:eukaryotic-like serine/threonine-protein kinase